MEERIKAKKSSEREEAYLKKLNTDILYMLTWNENLKNTAFRIAIHGYATNRGEHALLCIYHDSLRIVDVSVSLSDDEVPIGRYTVHTHYSPCNTNSYDRNLDHGEAIMHIKDALVNVSKGVKGAYISVVTDEILAMITEHCRADHYNAYTNGNKILIRGIEFLRVVHVSKDKMIIRINNDLHASHLGPNWPEGDAFYIEEHLQDLKNKILDRYVSFIAFMDICKQVGQLSVNQVFPDYDTHGEIYGTIDGHKVISYLSNGFISIMDHHLKVDSMDYGKLFLLVNGLKAMGR